MVRTLTPQSPRHLRSNLGRWRNLGTLRLHWHWKWVMAMRRCQQPYPQCITTAPHIQLQPRAWRGRLQLTQGCRQS